VNNNNNEDTGSDGDWWHEGDNNDDSHSDVSSGDGFQFESIWAFSYYNFQGKHYQGCFEIDSSF